MRKKVQKFWYEISQKKLTIPSAALILAGTSLGSNLLGVVRTRLIVTQFGAGHVTDIFYASFMLPDLIFQLLVLGGVASAFIPVFVESLGKKNKEESDLIGSNFLNFLLLSTVFIGVIIFILAPNIVPLILPGFFADGARGDFNTFEVSVMATRLMLLSPIFFAVSAVFGAMLNSHKKFLAYALAPIIYNISIIIGIIYFVPRTENPVYGLLGGVILGAMAHALIQLPSVIKSGFRWHPIIRLREYELPRIIKLMVPRVLAIGVSQINLRVDAAVASFFLGGITVMNLANDVQTLPTVVFGISIATAVFPSLAELSDTQNKQKFIKVFSESARKILYFMIPATIGVIVLRAQIVRLVYGAGNFSWENTYWTTKTLGYFAVGLVAQGLIPLCIRAFYALRDTKTPLLIGLIVMLVNLVLSVTLPFINFLGLSVAGVSLAFSIAGFVNAGLLLYYLDKKIGALDKDNKIFASTTRLVMASIIMGILSYYSLFFFDIFVDTHRVIGLAAQTLGAVFIGGSTYILITKLFGCEEAGIVFKKSL